MIESRRRVVRAVLAGLVAVGTVVTLVAAAGPAAAASCRTITGDQPGWDVQFMDTDGMQDAAVWRSDIRRSSNCDRFAIENWGFVNTAEDTARVRVRTYNEDYSVRVPGEWMTVQYGTFRTLREHVDANRLVRFDIHALEGFDSAARPPSKSTRLYI